MLLSENVRCTGGEALTRSSESMAGKVGVSKRQAPHRIAQQVDRKL
jgi:hypothetical protein